MKDYYKILGIKEDASQDEIKKIYRSLSKQYHPDVNPEGKEKFQEISEAYNIIGDENKRKQYDAERKNPYSHNEFGDLSDLINNKFNQFTQQRRQRAPDKVVTLNLTAFESFLGVKKDLKFQRKESCNTCNGQGGDRIKCNDCSGFGVKQSRSQIGGMIYIQNVTCPSCQGLGYSLTNVCFNCSGQGVKDSLSSITIDIPKSVDDGDFLRVPNSGDFRPNLGVGDLIVQIKIINDGKHQKMGQNLYYNLIISPEDVFKKNDIKLEHPEGQLMIKFPTKFNTSIPVRLRGKGYYFQEGRGDFIIKIDIDGSLSNIDEEKLEKIRNILE
jgi:molecular chaperone DnaJ